MYLARYLGLKPLFFCTLFWHQCKKSMKCCHSNLVAFYPPFAELYMIQQNADNLASVLFPLTLICTYCGRRTDTCFFLSIQLKTSLSLNAESWLSHFQTSETYRELSKSSLVGNWSVTTHEDKPHLCSLKPSVWSCSKLVHFCFPALGVVQDNWINKNCEAAHF